MEPKKIQKYIKQINCCCDYLACCLGLANSLGPSFFTGEANAFLDLCWALSADCHHGNVKNILDGGA